VVRFLLWAIAAAFKPRALLITANLCLRQQLLVLQRSRPQPRLTNTDRQFWIWINRWFGGVAQFAPDCETRDAVEAASTGLPCPLVVTVTLAAREGWSPPDSPATSGAHRRMTAENGLWDQRRIQAELAILRFTVSARTVAKYMNSRHSRGLSSGWRNFPKRHESSIWACDFFRVQTILFRSLYVFL
jgi:hypothetical protein